VEERGRTVSTSRSLFSPLRVRQWALRCVSGHFQDLFNSSVFRTRRAVLTPKITRVSGFTRGWSMRRERVRGLGEKRGGDIVGWRKGRD